MKRAPLPGSVLEQPEDYRLIALSELLLRQMKPLDMELRPELCESRLIPDEKPELEGYTCACGGNAVVTIPFDDTEADDPEVVRVCAICDGLTQWPRFGMETVWDDDE